MQVKDFDNLEKKFNSVSIQLNHIENLSINLINYICNYEDSSSYDIKSLTSVINEKISDLSEQLASIKQILDI